MWYHYYLLEFVTEGTGPRSTRPPLRAWVWVGPGPGARPPITRNIPPRPRVWAESGEWKPVPPRWVTNTSIYADTKIYIWFCSGCHCEPHPGDKPLIGEWRYYDPPGRTYQSHQLAKHAQPLPPCTLYLNDGAIIATPLPHLSVWWHTVYLPNFPLPSPAASRITGNVTCRSAATNTPASPVVVATPHHTALYGQMVFHMHIAIAKVDLSPPPPIKNPTC